MLSMHDMFVTRCCETRISQHFLLPVMYVDSVNAAKYFLPAKYKRVLPKKILIELAAAMAKCKAWENLMLPPPGGPGGGGGGVIAASGTRGGERSTRSARTTTRSRSTVARRRASRPASTC